MNFKILLSLLAGGMIALSATADSALAFNPQPDPPGRALKTNTVTTNNIKGQQFLPPGPCKNAMGARAPNVAGKMGPSTQHCLNPQPLPPG